MTYLGDFPVGATVHLKWGTNGANGASITRATNGSIRIYKNGSTTERSSGAGITDTEDFDSLTGVHHLSIDLSDGTDAGFYAAGSEYQVVLAAATIDGQTVNAVLGHFSIERYGNVYGMRCWLIDDKGGSTDRYVVAFLKNGMLVTTGLSSLSLQVIKASDGTNLIAAGTLTQIGSTGLYKYDATTTERITSGAAYHAKVSVTIDGAARSMVQPVGRDS